MSFITYLYENFFFSFFSIFTNFIIVFLITNSIKEYRFFNQWLFITFNIYLVVFGLVITNLAVLNNVQYELIISLNSKVWNIFGFVLHLNFSIINCFFFLLVSIISLATNIYSLHYLEETERQETFVFFLNFFVISMIILTLSDNTFTLLLGWELIGLTSFLLINFWKLKKNTLNCSFKAFFFNKISDVSLMIAIGYLWNVNNNFELYMVLNDGFFMNYIFNTFLDKSCIYLLICSCIKSAQIFGHVWLADSMEAPVPASALIHSATLVSAGIFLILKFSNLFFCYNYLNYCFYIGACTALYGGVVAATQDDAKKILAYSTISHCGFLFISLSIQNWMITILYLYLHGFCKALSFFSLGSIIRYFCSQDIRHMGNLNSHRVEALSLIFSLVNLAALPYTFGFLYKYSFMKILLHSGYHNFWVIFVMLAIQTSLIYAIRSLNYIIFDFYKGNKVFLNIQTQISRIRSDKSFWTTDNSKVLASMFLAISMVITFWVFNSYFFKNAYYLIIHLNDYCLMINLWEEIDYRSTKYFSYAYNLLFMLVIICFFLYHNKRINNFEIKERRLIYISWFYVSLYLVALIMNFVIGQLFNFYI